jgi:uncharacterized protein YjiS (DUF1127 family)
MINAIDNVKLSHRSRAAWWQPLVQVLRAWHHARSTRRALERLDDRMLKDIGVNRCEITARAAYLAQDSQGWWRP